MLLGPICGPDPRRLADRERELALDLPHQRADRLRRRRSTRCSRCRATTRTRASRSTSSACVLMSPGLALFLYGVSSIPGEGDVPLGQGAHPDDHRCGAHGRVRPAHVPARSTRCSTCACSQPRPARRDDHDVPVRRRVLRRSAARPDVLPAGPGRVDPRGRSARRTAGHRRDGHHADRRARCPTAFRSAGSSRSAWCSSPAACSR